MCVCLWGVVCVVVFGVLVWCVWLLVCGCVWFGVCVCETTHRGVLDMSTGRGGGEGLSLSLPFCPCFFLYFVLFLLLLFSSLLSSFLFPSRQQTLKKTRINQHGVQLRGVIWRELHSTSFSARHVVTHVTILPSSSPSPPPPPPPLPTRKRELFIAGIFPARNLFLLQF